MCTLTSRGDQLARSPRRSLGGPSPWQCKWPTSSVRQRSSMPGWASSSSQRAIVSMNMPGSGSKPMVTCREAAYSSVWPRPSTSQVRASSGGISASLLSARPKRDTVALQGGGQVDGVFVEFDPCQASARAAESGLTMERRFMLSPLWGSREISGSRFRLPSRNSALRSRSSPQPSEFLRVRRDDLLRSAAVPCGRL